MIVSLGETEFGKSAFGPPVFYFIFTHVTLNVRVTFHTPVTFYTCVTFHTPVTFYTCVTFHTHVTLNLRVTRF